MKVRSIYLVLTMCLFNTVFIESRFGNIGNHVLGSIDHSLKKVLLSYIAGAKDKIRCAMFLLTDKELIKALAHAVDRKVDVSVIVDKGSVEKNSYIEVLKKRKVLAVYSASGLMHNKFWIVDDQAAITGSFNGTEAADKMHCENLLITTDRDLVHDYAEIFNQIEEKVQAQQLKRKRKERKEKRDFEKFEAELKAERRKYQKKSRS